MNEVELKNWFIQAEICLRVVGYTSEEVYEILDWFKGIRGSAERALIGDAAVDAFTDVVLKSIVDITGAFNLHHSLMSRLFMYAPLILKEWRENVKTN